MYKTAIAKIAKSLAGAAKRHSPEILTGLGIAGMVAATVFAVKATPKACRLIDEAGARKSKELDQGSEGLDGELTPVEVVRTAWKCYIPAAVTCAASMACLIGASSVNFRRNALLATAYSLSESAMKEYREKVAETLGEKKEQSVRDALAKDAIERNPVANTEVIVTSKGNTLCHDVISGRYFESDIEKLRKAANDLNREMLSDLAVSVNDLYFEIGLPLTKQGDKLGWNVCDGFIDFKFSAQLTEDGRPCIVLDYLVPPRYDFQNR